jgi:hypothetical protein
MRPRVVTSAEPISCADVNVGLIEVSPSLVKACCAVKPPSGISGRFLSGSYSNASWTIRGEE